MSDVVMVGIVGSPRHRGNTDLLVDAILEGGKEAGAEIAKIFLDDLTILPCKACNRCGTTRKCIQNDDFESVVEVLEQCQIWVLGTPVYWWGPTAQFKAFLDRWYSLDRRVFNGRRVILAVPSGGGEMYAEHTVGLLEEVIRYLRMKHDSTILAPGSGDRGSVRKNERLMEKARQEGRRVAELLI